VRMSNRTLFLGGAGLVAAGIIALGLMLPAKESTGGLDGTKAPEFSAVTIDPPIATKTLHDYEGSVVLLNVWATWCPPCIKEMPTMEQLHQAYRDRGLRVVAISVDDAGSTDLIREFRDEQKLTFEILHDPQSAIFDSYKLNGVPMTFLIDRTGIIRLTRYAADWFAPENRREVEKLLK
jgi:peroxiredoxin